jgi:hypothetical protein
MATRLTHQDGARRTARRPELGQYGPRRKEISRVWNHHLNAHERYSVFAGYDLYWARLPRKLESASRGLAPAGVALWGSGDPVLYDIGFGATAQRIVSGDLCGPACLWAIRNF